MHSQRSGHLRGCSREATNCFIFVSYARLGRFRDVVFVLCRELAPGYWYPRVCDSHVLYMWGLSLSRIDICFVAVHGFTSVACLLLLTGIVDIGLGPGRYIGWNIGSALGFVFMVLPSSAVMARQIRGRART